MVSLSILKSLATECRHNIALISPALLASLNATLSQVLSDIEVVARTATVVSAIYHEREYGPKAECILLSSLHGPHIRTDTSLGRTAV